MSEITDERLDAIADRAEAAPARVSLEQIFAALPEHAWEGSLYSDDTDHVGACWCGWESQPGSSDAAYAAWKEHLLGVAVAPAVEGEEVAHG